MGVSLMSRSAWFVSSLFFWVFLAGMEVTGALMLNGFPPPLGKGSMPTAMDAHYLVVAVSLYALLGILAGLILFGCEMIFSWLKGKAVAPSLDLNRMDLYLLFAFGLLYFKWISQLLPPINRSRKRTAGKIVIRRRSMRFRK